MADNITLDSGSGGETLATAEVTFSGDTAQVQIQAQGIVTGSAESYAVTLVVGGAGAVGAGVQRMTLASDDPAVALLGTIDTDTGAMVVDLAAIEVLLTAMDADTSNIATDSAAMVVDLAAIEVLLTSMDSDTAALVVDLAAIEVLLTSMDTDTAAMVVDLAAIEVLLTAMDADTSNMATALQIMDDWDESDRAKVNIVVGQAGVDVGSGAAGAATPRVILATDDPAVTALELIDDTVYHFGSDTYTEATSEGLLVGGVRNDDLATLADTDNEIAPFQFDKQGSLYVQPAQQVDYVFDGSEKCTIKRFNVLATADGDDIIAAPTGTKKIRVRSMAVIAISTTATTIYLQIATTGTDIFGDAANPIPIGLVAITAAHPSIYLPVNDDGWFETPVADEALEVKMPGGNQAMLFVGTYIEVD